MCDKTGRLLLTRCDVANETTGVQKGKSNTGCFSLPRGENKTFERLNKMSSEWGFSSTHLI